MKKVQSLLFAALVATTTPAIAQSLSWDAGATGGASLGGTGNWDTNTDALWFNGTADVLWTNGLDAYFEGTAGTVTLTNSISAADIYFTNVTGNYLITNDNNGEVLTVGSIIDTGGSEDTIGASIANSTTLNKNGVGRLHLPVPNNISGSVMVNQGELSVETNNVMGGSVTVADGAALEFNGGAASVCSNITTSMTINGTGITNSGSLRNRSGVTTLNQGTITLGENNSIIYSDPGSAFVYNTLDGPVTDGGNNYNLIVSGPGNFKILFGGISIGGTVIVSPGANAYFYLTGLTANFKSSLVSTGATLFVENNISFGSQPATLITTNCTVDGGTISSAGTYTMYPNTGITVTTNGGTLINTSGTWTTGNIYSSNAPVTLNCIGSMRPGGAAGGTLGTINLGTGTLIKSGTADCNLGFANASLEIYSNIQVNGSGSLTFNYDAANGTTSLGAVPTTLNPSNIWLNGGSLHIGHTTTIGATRGIYVTSAGGNIQDVVSSGGTVTINSPISGPGAMNFSDGHGGTTSGTVLAANNTYAGTTTVGTSNILTVGSGGGTGTLGTGNTILNGRLVFNRTGSYTYNGNISGFSNVVNSGSGTIMLGGINTYAGSTAVNAGTLDINGTNGGSALTVASGATLGGTGLINSTVTVNAGGTLALGAGTLSVSNNVSIAGNITVSVNKSLTPSNGMANVTGTLANTGTGRVTVSNLGPALTAGDTFQLFSQPLTTGNNMNISGGSVVWANNLAANGSISVVGPLPQPVVTNVMVSGTNLVMSGNNGYTGGPYSVLATTNLLLPLGSWTTVQNNNFSASGTFSITNPMLPSAPARYFTLKLQ